MSPPLLAKPQDGETLQLYIAVSTTAVSAVLVREEDKPQHPVYYVSKSLLDAETGYTSMEKIASGPRNCCKKVKTLF